MPSPLTIFEIFLRPPFVLNAILRKGTEVGVSYSRNAIRVIHESVRVHKKQQSDPSSFPYHGWYFFPYSTCTSRRILHRTRESTSLFRSKRIRDRVRYVAFSMLLLKRDDASQYSNWLCHSSVWVYSFFRASFVYHFFSLISTYSFLSSFAFFCTCFSFFVLFEFLLFFYYKSVLLYIVIFAYNVYRKMKFNARIDKLNVNLYAFNWLTNC